MDLQQSKISQHQMMVTFSPSLSVSLHVLVIVYHYLSIIIVPGSVIGLSFTKVSATVLQISWSEPEVTNGVIQSYSIQVDNHIDTVFQESVPGNQKSILVTNLSKLT